ncbi:MAG: OmpA family protein [Alphaproteobacteria bacterium]|nr:OmpA family protein [Alphaproteobacteria bacterium]
MKLVTRVCAVLGVLALTACTGASSSSTVDALNKAQAVGSPFTKMLSGEYREYANYLQTKTLDYADAIHFARKGLATASGVIAMPETLDDWDLSDKNLSEMNPARAQLVDALEDGGRELASAKAAVAQARFDCWAEQQEENWNKDVPCKSQFFAALKDLQDAIAVKPAPAPAPAEEFPAPVTEMAKGPAVPVQEAMFIVFFDWNKHNISAGANDVLDAVAQEVKSRKDVKGLVVVGHTDSSGSAKYNQKLSLKRANAVKAGLVSRGVPADMIRVEARGETDLLVKTKDNVREPANRRAQITLE